MPVNVVTYTAVVEAPNAELKLLPGMTANLVFQIDKHEKVLKIPNAALRFHPKPEYVHPKHLTLLEGLHAENEEEGEEKTVKTAEQDEDADADPAPDAESASKKEVKKYVWIVDGDLLSPVEIKVGINDSHHTEMISGDLKERPEGGYGHKNGRRGDCDFAKRRSRILPEVYDEYFDHHSRGPPSVG